MKAAPRKLPRIEPRPPMMIMNSRFSERLMSNAAGSQEPRCTNAHSAPATPDEERADREGGELGVDRADADHLGGDVHVAHRHPGPAHVAAHQVLRHQREDHHEAEAEEVLLDRRVDGPAEDIQRRHRHRARRRIVGQPADPLEGPVGEELRRQGRHRQVEAPDAQARNRRTARRTPSPSRPPAGRRRSGSFPGSARRGCRRYRLPPT